MKIDLTQFEQQINPTILKRGLQYYKNGKVDILSESSNTVEALVEGSDGEPYYTVLYLEGDTVTDSVCNCPYDSGPVCKHIAAVIFEIKADELELAAKPSSESKKPTKTKAQKDSDKMREILQNASQEQLASFIKDICKEYREIRQLFITKFTPKDKTQSKSDYKLALSTYAQSLMRHGYVDYRSADLLGNAFYETCRMAEERLSMGDYISAVNAATAVIEQASSALQYSDDSNGSISDPIYSAVNILSDIADSELDEDSRKYLFKYCLTSYKKKIFNGWDWHDHMLEVATQLVKQQSEIEEVRLLIEDQIKSSKYDWKVDSSKKLMAEFILNTEGEDAMNEYKYKNLDVDSFMEEAIESALQIKNYTTARKLIDKAFENSMPNKDKWHNFNFRLTCATSSTDDIICLSRQLVIDIFQGFEDYYRKFKSLVAPEEWIALRAELYEDILKKKGWDRVKYIATLEQDWETYMKWVKSSESYYTLSTAEKELPSSYNPQLVEQYIRVIRANIDNCLNPKRSVYEKATQAMRRMKKLGGLAEVTALADEFRAKYRRRKALLEELDMI
ncbi:MAG: hypothetical protein R3Y26_05115 [Rikenellaceae bacterium]